MLRCSSSHSFPFSFASFPLTAISPPRASMNEQRSRVIRLYKTLYHLGKEYPKGAGWFHDRLKTAFLRNREERDPEKIKHLVERGEFVVKEIEALYQLRKYRAMKQRYYDAE